ncbi:MAG: hypothetical protein ACLFV4_07800 [Candidatus Hydrogenedentota bacterium]
MAYAVAQPHDWIWHKGVGAVGERLRYMGIAKAVPDNPDGISVSPVNRGDERLEASPRRPAPLQGQTT